MNLDLTKIHDKRYKENMATHQQKTLQKIFNKVSKHLLTQGVRSLGYSVKADREICRYRTPDGLKCAVGCLIKAKVYREELEYRGVEEDVVQQALEDSGYDMSDNATQSLLDTLQEIHDWSDPSRWKADLTELAIKFDLKLPPILV